MAWSIGTAPQIGKDFSLNPECPIKRAVLDRFAHALRRDVGLVVPWHDELS